NPTASCSRSSRGRASRERSSRWRSARAAPSSGCACIAHASACVTPFHLRKSDSPEDTNMSGRNAMDSLQRLSAVSDAEAAAVFGVAGREELLADLTHLPFGRGASARRAQRSRRPLVLALAVVVAAATAAAAWAILGSSAQETTSIECVIAGTDTIIPASSGDPAADCALQWQRDLGTTPPPLVAYDNGEGGVTVIPSGEKPQAGWTALPGRSQDVALIQLQESLDDYVNGLNSTCLDGAAATALAHAKL